MHKNINSIFYAYFIPCFTFIKSCVFIINSLQLLILWLFPTCSAGGANDSQDGNISTDTSMSSSPSVSGLATAPQTGKILQDLIGDGLL